MGIIFVWREEVFEPSESVCEEFNEKIGGLVESIEIMYHHVQI